MFEGPPSLFFVADLTQATERSATFRLKIDAINATDGLIYVHEGHCEHRVFTCLVHTVEVSGPFRLLHVKLDVRRSERDSMAAIGHEALLDPAGQEGVHNVECKSRKVS